MKINRTLLLMKINIKMNLSELEDGSGNQEVRRWGREVGKFSG